MNIESDNNKKMSAKKNALGRGLGALMEDSEPRGREIEESSGLIEIDIELIDANPFQPRKEFEEESLKELAASIRELGIIQPVTVRAAEEGRFQLIVGERRFRAAGMAGLEKIPAYIRTANDQGLLEMALVENIQREDLDAIEIAISYQRLMEECSLTQDNLSERVGKKRSTISNYQRLLKLPAEVQLGIKKRDLSMGHARALVNIEDSKAQLEVFRRIIDEDLSVRKTEEIVRKINDSGALEKSEKKSSGKQGAEEYKALKDHLSEYFGTKIDLQRNEKGKGKIVIPFNSNEELERIVGVFDKIRS